MQGESVQVPWKAGCGIDPNSRDGPGRTYLHRICEGGGPMGPDEVEVVRQLLDAGADPNARDCFERSPLGLLCAERPNVEACAALLDKGADIFATDVWGRTPLHWCADRGHADLARFLIQRGANVHLSTTQGDNCVLWAAKGGHVQVAKLLLDAGCDPTVRNNRGECALEVAMEEGDRLAALFAAWCEKRDSLAAQDAQGTSAHAAGPGSDRGSGECSAAKDGAPATSPSEAGTKRMAAERPAGGLVSPPEVAREVGLDRSGDHAGSGEVDASLSTGPKAAVAGPGGAAGVPVTGASSFAFQRPFGTTMGAQKQGKKLKITLKPKETVT